MKEIAQHPENRFDWWIMKTFMVLPTDQRFLDLTPEQRELLWEHYLLDNPELAKKIENRINDPEFEKEWEELAYEEAQNSFENEVKVVKTDNAQDGFDEIEKAYEKYLQQNKDLELPNYKEILASKGINLEKLEQDVQSQKIDFDLENDFDDEWEEVSD